MTSNYDVFFVFGKEKKLHQRIFLGGVGALPSSQFENELVAAKNPYPMDSAILDLRMQILD
jgi:hypothetical protein